MTRKKILTIATCCLLLGNVLHAQVLKTIDEIQTPISWTNDTSVLHGTAVLVKGVVMTDPNKWYQATNQYSFWIQEKGQSGQETGLQIRLNQGSAHGASTGLTGLQVGMEVEIQGKVDYFAGEIQVALDTTTSITILSLGNAIAGPSVVPVSTLNIGAVSGTSQSAQPTGEPWQGSYIEIQNVTVTSVNTSPTRGNFTVQDANGNQIVVFDSNIDMRLNQNGWTKPTVGTVYSYIRGICYHRKFPNGQNNFEIQPWNLSDLLIGSAPPDIQSVTRNPSCPNPSGAVTVIATITHPAGEPILSATLKYAVGASNLTYTSVPMTQTTPGIWEGTIPAQPDGSFVHYYVEAVDSSGDIDKFPNFTPRSYRVNQNGCTITDIQYVAPDIQQGTSKWYESGYVGQVVTGVKGVVVASSNDLGYIYIQEGGKTAWAGIQIIGDATVNNLQLGDSVAISGEVREYFGLTQIFNASATVLQSNVPYNAITLPLSQFADTMTVQNEAYESMLIRFVGPDLAVVNPTVDLVLNSNLGDYRVGTDVFDPNRGIRVLAGRQTNNIFSSLNCAYVNNSSWQVTDGAMNVTPYVVDNDTRLDEITGILTYAWNYIKLLPRNSADLVNVRQLTVSNAKNVASNIFLYPNPATDEIRIIASEPVQTFQVLDCTGKEIMFLKPNATQCFIPIQNLPQGLYLIKVQIKDQTQISRFIKQ